jgi:hypothetical protein
VPNYHIQLDHLFSKDFWLSRASAATHSFIRMTLHVCYRLSKDDCELVSTSLVKEAVSSWHMTVEMCKENLFNAIGVKPPKWYGKYPIQHKCMLWKCLSFSAQYWSMSDNTNVIDVITHQRYQWKMWGSLQVNDGPVEVDMYQKISQIDTWCHWKTGFEVEIGVGSESSTKVIQSFNQYLHDSRELIFGLPAAIPGSTSNPSIDEQPSWWGPNLLEHFVARVWVLAEMCYWCRSFLQEDGNSDSLDNLQTKAKSWQRLPWESYYLFAMSGNEIWCCQIW